MRLRTPVATFVLGDDAQPAGAAPRHRAGAVAAAERAPALAVALARLEAATLTRDSAAAHRILDGLTATADGQWLLVQMASAGFRALGIGIQHQPGPPRAEVT